MFKSESVESTEMMLIYNSEMICAVKKTSLADKIEFYLSKNMYDEALTVLSNNNAVKYPDMIRKIENAHLYYMLQKSSDYDRFRLRLPVYLDGDKKRWVYWLKRLI